MSRSPENVFARLTSGECILNVGSNGVKFTYHNYKSKYYAPVFSVSIGFPCKVNGFVKTSAQESLLQLTYCGTEFISQSKIGNIGFHFHCEHFPVINKEWGLQFYCDVFLMLEGYISNPG